MQHWLDDALQKPTRKAAQFFILYWLLILPIMLLAAIVRAIFEMMLTDALFLIILLPWAAIFWVLNTPMWLWGLVGLPTNALTFTAMVYLFEQWRWRKRLTPEARIAHWQCPACGFDLTGSRSAPNCPECGEPVPKALREWFRRLPAPESNGR